MDVGLALYAGNSPVTGDNREAGDLRRHRGHYDVIVMVCHGWDAFICLFILQYSS